MPSSVFIFTFLRDITAMLPIFYLHVLRKNLEWNYCGHTGMECYKITMCVCLDLYYEKSEAAVFLFLSPLKKTNKQTKTGEYLKSQFSPESIQTALTLCHFVGMKKRRKKCLYIFYIYVFGGDCCFLSVKQHSIPDQILFQYTPTTRSLIRVIGMCTLTHL